MYNVLIFMIYPYIENVYISQTMQKIVITGLIKRYINMLLLHFCKSKVKPPKKFKKNTQVPKVDLHDGLTQTISTSANTTNFAPFKFDIPIQDAFGFVINIFYFRISMKSKNIYYANISITIIMKLIAHRHTFVVTNSCVS